MVAAKMGGSDPNANPRLRAALTSAKAVNMPNANIERAIKKGAGELGDVVYEEITYEGYAAGGVAVMVECLTDNKNRSISDVRMTFDRNNGNLAASGAVARMFKRMAHFTITGDWADEEKLMDVVLEAGADDLTVEDGGVYPLAAPRKVGYYLTHANQAKQDLSAARWKIGFLKRLAPLPLPYDRLYAKMKK